MTAVDPRVGDIEAREALVHVKCADCAKCRVAEESVWCVDCEYWGCERGPDCEDDPNPTTVAYLLAELRKRDEALARVEAVAEQWTKRGEHDMAFSKTIPDEDIAMVLLTEGASMVENARHIRNALKGDGA